MDMNMSEPVAKGPNSKKFDVGQKVVAGPDIVTNVFIAKKVFTIYALSVKILFGRNSGFGNIQLEHASIDK